MMGKTSKYSFRLVTVRAYIDVLIFEDVVE